MENRVGFILPDNDRKNRAKISVDKFHRFFAIIYIGKYLGFFPISLDEITLQNGKKYYQLTSGKTFQSLYRFICIVFTSFFVLFETKGRYFLHIVVCF